MKSPLDEKSSPLGGNSFGDSNLATGCCSVSDHAVAQSYISEKTRTVRESADHAAVARSSSWIVAVQPSRFDSITSSVSERKCIV